LRFFGQHIAFLDAEKARLLQVAHDIDQVQLVQHLHLELHCRRMQLQLGPQQGGVDGDDLLRFEVVFDRQQAVALLDVADRFEHREAVLGAEKAACAQLFELGQEVANFDAFGLGLVQAVARRALLLRRAHGVRLGPKQHEAPGAHHQHADQQADQENIGGLADVGPALAAERVSLDHDLGFGGGRLGAGGGGGFGFH